MAIVMSGTVVGLSFAIGFYCYRKKAFRRRSNFVKRPKLFVESVNKNFSQDVLVQSRSMKSQSEIFSIKFI